MSDVLTPLIVRKITPCQLWRSVGAACLAGLLVAGCGGDDDSAPADAPPAAQPSVSPGAGTPADGSGTGQTPIVALPTQGCDVAIGDPAVRAPLLNTQLDCAP